MWICAYTSRSVRGVSATENFQMAYNRSDKSEIFNLKRPVWRLTFMNAEQLEYVYEENDLPTGTYC